MFSLVIAIIAIALIVAVMVVSAYHGGATLTDARSQAEAARLRNEGQQILVAVSTFYADQRRYPANLQELVDTQFLRSIPKGYIAEAVGFTIELISTAHAAESASLGWNTPITGKPIYKTAVTVPVEVCRQYNKAVRGDDGILKMAYNTLTSQCFGKSGTYQVLIGTLDAMPYLADAVGSGSAAEGAVPPVDADDAWDKPVADAPGAPTEPSAKPEPHWDAPVFPRTRIGKEVASAVVLRNTASEAIPLSALTVSGAGFSLAAGSTCPTLAPSGSCSLTVIFKPTAEGHAAGSLVFASNDKNYSVSLAADAVGLAIVASKEISKSDAATTVAVLGANFPLDTQAKVLPSGTGFVTVTDSGHLAISLNNTGEDVNTITLTFPDGQPDIPLGEVDARVPLRWVMNYGPELTMASAGLKATMAVAQDSEAYTSRTYSRGKWYLEAYFGVHGVLTLNGNGQGRYFDARWNDNGGSATVLAGSNTVTGARGRYGYAADIDARTWTIYNLANCAVMGQYRFNGSGSYHLAFTARKAHDAVGSYVELFTSPGGGRDCKPAGFKWW